VEKRFAHKIERYFKNHFKLSAKDKEQVNLQIVVFDEDLYTVAVLSEIQHLI
jgi:RNase H-fold protein (predicted Holliday junction resolvase)